MIPGVASKLDLDLTDGGSTPLIRIPAPLRGAITRIYVSGDDITFMGLYADLPEDFEVDAVPETPWGVGRSIPDMSGAGSYLVAPSATDGEDYPNPYGLFDLVDADRGQWLWLALSPAGTPRTISISYIDMSPNKY